MDVILIPLLISYIPRFPILIYSLLIHINKDGGPWIPILVKYSNPAYVDFKTFNTSTNLVKLSTFIYAIRPYVPSAFTIL